MIRADTQTVGFKQNLPIRRAQISSSAGIIVQELTHWVNQFRPIDFAKCHNSRIDETSINGLNTHFWVTAGPEANHLSAFLPQQAIPQEYSDQFTRVMALSEFCMHA